MSQATCIYFCTLVLVFHVLGHPRISQLSIVCTDSFLFPGTSQDIPLTFQGMFYSTLVPGLSRPWTSWDVPGHPKASQATCMYICTTALWSLVFHILGLPGTYRNIPLYYCTVVPGLSCPGTHWDIPSYVHCTTTLWSLVFHVLGRTGISLTMYIVLLHCGPWSFTS